MNDSLALKKLSCKGNSLNCYVLKSAQLFQNSTKLVLCTCQRCQRIFPFWLRAIGAIGTVGGRPSTCFRKNVLGNRSTPSFLESRACLILIIPQSSKKKSDSFGTFNIDPPKAESLKPRASSHLPNPQVITKLLKQFQHTQLLLLYDCLGDALYHFCGQSS